MGRAFYRLPLTAWPDLSVPDDGLIHGEPATPEIAAIAAATLPRRPGDCFEVSRTTSAVYVLAATDPCEPLVALGAVWLGARLSELSTADAKHFTHVLIERVVKAESGATHTERLMVPSTALKRGDAAIGEPTMRAMFSGDQPADYL